MPLRKKITKGKTKVKTTVKQAQNVRQSVKVVIEAPKPRRRAPAKPTKKDLLSGLMRAPEYTTFRDLTPAVSSTGYNSVPPPHPLKNDPHQIQLKQQDQIGSVSGSLSIAPAGLLKAPEEEKKSNEDAPEEVIVSGAQPFNPRRDLTKEEMRLARAELALIEREEKKAREEQAKKEKEQAERARLERDRLRKLEREQEQAKEAKADAFRRQRLQKDVFGAYKRVIRPDIVIEDMDF